MRWALVTGNKGDDKPARLRAVIDGLAARGLSIGGVVQEPLDDEDGRAGYVARELRGEGRIALARKARASDQGDAKSHLVCSFAFDAENLARVRTWVERDARACDVVVIDEVSKLEVAGGGHHDSVLAALSGTALVLLCVRADQLFAVMERFGLDEPIASLESGGDLPAFVDAVR